MRFHASRIMCHDDIRAIRKVYGLAVKRDNIQYDYVCRRDFPMNGIQKSFYRFNRWIRFDLGGISSFIVFLMTIIYLILKKRRFNEEQSHSRSSSQSSQSFANEQKTRLNAFLWHDDLPFN